MKTILIGIGVVILVIVVAWLFPWSRDYAAQTRSDIDRSFAEQVRDERVFDAAHQEIGERTDFLSKQYAKVIQGKEEHKRQQSQLDKKRAELARQEADLNKAFEWIDAHGAGDTTTLGGQEYDYATIVADARTRAGICENLRTTITTLEQNCDILNNAVLDGEANVKQALAKVREVEGELAAKEVQMAAWGSIQAVKAIAQDMTFTGDNAEIVSNRALEEVDRRLADMKADVAFSEFEMSMSKGVVPWNNGDANAADLGALNSYRQRYLEPAPEPQPAEVSPQ